MHLDAAAAYAFAANHQIAPDEVFIFVTPMSMGASRSNAAS
jgi:hypothetical protein